MTPWIWWWAPSLRVQLPLGGDVTQDIDPDLSWFFDGIPPSAGDGRIEHQAFDVASYGRQLGWITEVLIGLAEREGVPAGQAAESLRKLRQVRDEIERIKDAAHDAEVEDLARRVAQVRRRGGTRAARLRARLRQAPGKDDPPPA